jgi:uncharacterized membrane protein
MPDEDRLLRNLLVLFVILVLVVPAVMLVVMTLTGSFSAGSFGMMDWWGGGWGLMMVPVGILLIVMILIVVALSDRPAPNVAPYPPGYFPPVPSPPASGDAIAILDRRLAAGEIGVDEYNRIKAELLKR